ncbi:hypothetical protein COSO111634_37525 [Corallococcus soli]
MVPFTVPTWVRSRLFFALAMPKSSSFTVPSYVTMMFFCATSRWMTGLGWPPGDVKVCA